MKKFFMFLLAGVLCAGFAACSDDDDEDEGGSSASGSSYSSSAIVGTWRLDYELYDEDDDEWDYEYYYSEDVVSSWDEKMVLSEDGAYGWWERIGDGTWIYDDGTWDEYGSTGYYRWSITGSTLTITGYEYNGSGELDYTWEEFVYNIVELTSTTLIIEETYEDEDYSYYDYMKYVKE